MATTTIDRKEYRRALKRTATLEKLLKWTDEQLQKLIDASAEERKQLLAEVAATDGERRDEPKKKVRSKRKSKNFGGLPE